MELLNKVIARITPKDASIKKEIDEIVSIINKELKKNKIKATAVVGGSFAKDTHLVDDHDCDIFVKFDYKYKDKHISDLLHKSLKKFKPNRLHGSRDYFQFSKTLNYEIVPVIEIKNPDQALNVTDVSPLHVNWTKKHKKSSEIRLVKAFCKSAGIYGAESYIKGFSGHVLDILTIYYGSFMNLLKQSQKWKEGTVIDVEKHYKSQDVFKIMNSSKLESPMIAVDPVQKERNAAAALSFENFCIFRSAAKSFVSSPSGKFFEITDLEDSIKKKFASGKIIKIEIAPLKGKADVAGSKIQKISEFFSASLVKSGFKIRHFAWNFENKAAEMYFVFDKKPIGKEMAVEGPPLSMELHVLNFRKTHKKTFKKRGKIFALEKRKFMLPEKLLQELSKNSYVGERCKEIKIKAM